MLCSFCKLHYGLRLGHPGYVSDLHLVKNKDMYTFKRDSCCDRRNLHQNGRFAIGLALILLGPGFFLGSTCVLRNHVVADHLWFIRFKNLSMKMARSSSLGVRGILGSGHIAAFFRCMVYMGESGEWEYDSSTRSMRW